MRKNKRVYDKMRVLPPDEGVVSRSQPFTSPMGERKKGSGQVT